MRWIIYLVFILYIFLLYLIFSSFGLQEWDCRGCTTLIDNECQPYNIGVDCVPDNYGKLIQDLVLYHEFYYSRTILIEGVRCLDYGISVHYVPGMAIESSLTPAEFQQQYKGFFTRDCENWSFAPI